MDFEEITELHNRIAFALRMAGLKRAALRRSMMWLARLRIGVPSSGSAERM